MGWELPPLYGTSKFYALKKLRALSKIAKLHKIVEECDKELAKNEENK